MVGSSLGRVDLPPQDPRTLLTSIGVALYDWDVASDAIAWAPNAAQVLGLPDLSTIARGADLATLSEPGTGPTGADVVRAASGRDTGSGVPYEARYAIRTKPGTVLAITESGRWYAALDGTPARVHGMIRITGSGEGDASGPGQQERTTFLRMLAAEMPDALRAKRPLSLFTIAIENLAEINERFGFEGGDAAVAAVLGRLRTVMRRRDGFVRYSGNRFAMALRACPPDQARIAAERLDASVEAEPIVIQGEPIRTSLLIGAASAPDHASDATVLLRRAEQCLAIAKRRAGSRFVLYDPHAFRRGERAPETDGALDVIGLLNARSILFARQPVVDVHSRETVFSEALLRVRGSGERVVAAADIVPAMERAGLVPLVDMRILELAVDHLVRHPEERLSVNLSPMTLDSPDWLATLAAHVGRSGDVASRLIVEVTETIAIRDPDGTRRKLDAMKALGVTLAIDDFGAGHTSFKHLRNFPVDIVKIDGAFVQNLCRSESDVFFVRTLVDLAHHLGLQTVAEWVEDEETALKLAEFGVDYLQGDHLGVPVVAGPIETAARRAG